MAVDERATEDAWIAVVARSLAFLCLHAADLRTKDLVRQAALLDGLGLPRREAARMLGTSEDSLRVLQARAAKAKGGKRGQAKRGG